MTNKKKSPVKNTVEEPTGRAENPFQNAEFYARMRDYTERDAAFSKELAAIAARGAGKQNTDARFAPSLQVLRAVVKKGLPLEDMLGRIVLGTEKGLWEPWLTVFGIELCGVNYATGPRNARLALDMEDCAQVQIEKPTEKTPAKVTGIFYLDAVEK